MQSTWTAESVLALAPDESSAKAGQGLASAKKWSALGRSTTALWGEIKGSGADPYQTRIDLSEPAFKCSCPSRKFPCKHALGLLLVFAKEPAAFHPGELPGWVADWLSTREKRTEKRAGKAAAETAAAPDLEAQAKRVGQREARVADGLAQLSVWLGDLVRLGFAHAQTQPGSFWEGMAARLVDAQAPGLARSVRRLAQIVAGGPGWEHRLLNAVARLELLRCACLRQDALVPELREEVRAAIGWTQSQEDVLAGAGLSDTWFTLGTLTETEDRLRVRRTWLWGTKAQRPALVLEFAAGTQALDAGLPAGHLIDAELCFFAGTLGLRALIKARTDLRVGGPALPGSDSIEAALTSYADALGRAPWVERWPLALRAVTPRLLGHEDGPSWFLTDRAGASLALPARMAEGWHLLALSGGSAIDMFGEWDGEVLRPLTIAARGMLYALGGRAPLTPLRSGAATPDQVAA